MNGTDRVRIAIQKKGRLSERSSELLKKCGLDFDWRTDQLVCSSTSFPLDLMLIRDDDIPHYVLDGICELGIVGQNVLEEVLEGKPDGTSAVTVLEKLGFGGCRLSVAVPRGARGQDARHELPQPAAALSGQEGREGRRGGDHGLGGDRAGPQHRRRHL